jgi:hypothetical protein
MSKKISRRKVVSAGIAGAGLFGLGYLSGRALAQTPYPNIYLDNLPSTASYIIYTDGTYYYATRADGYLAFGGPVNRGGVSGTDALAVFRAVENVAPTGSLIFVRHGDYVFSATWNPTKKLRLHGEGSGTRLLNNGPYDAINTTNLALLDIVYQTADGVLHDASFDPNMFGDILRGEMLAKDSTVSPLTFADYNLLTIDLGVAQTDVLIATNVTYLKVISATSGATYSIKLFDTTKPSLDQTIIPAGAEITGIRRANIYLTNSAQAGYTLKLLVFMG